MVTIYKPIYTVPEVAKVLTVSKNAAYELLRKGKIPYLLINNSKKVKGSDLERFIENHPIENVE